MGPEAPAEPQFEIAKVPKCFLILRHTVLDYLNLMYYTYLQPFLAPPLTAEHNSLT
jgi:hypothetical protein